MVGLLLGDTFFFLTLRDLGARATLLISALIPPVTALISSAWIGEGLAASEWLGLVITGVGVCLVVSKNEGGQPAHLRGLLFGGLLVGTTALGNVMTKVGGHRLDGLPVAVLRLAVAVGALFLVMAILRRLPDLAVPWRTPRADGADARDLHRDRARYLAFDVCVHLVERRRGDGDGGDEPRVGSSARLPLAR